jgi:basic amino acid/polyamine antiporter, APA family
LIDNPKTSEAGPPAELTRGFGLLRATALNMSNVVGVGPFITIPLMLAAMGGPQALLGWTLGAILAVCDGLVWSELGAAWPGSGGSYRFLREAYGPERFGRLMAFLFIWQFCLSGPLEIASGMIGFSQYTSYLVPGMTAMQGKLLAAGVGALALVLLYRRIHSVGKLTVTLWAGTVLTMAAVIVAGLPHFSAKLAFSFPPNAFTFSRGFFLGLGSAMLISMYDYMGYYDVCYIGDEVRDPARTIPRSILYCILATSVGYLAIETVIIGVMPWQQAMKSNFVVSEFIQQLHGRPAAIAVTAMIMWTAFGSVFALLLGYSRIPYAAAKDGYFFRPFARVHPTQHFPHVSLLAIGAVAIGAAFFKLETVISAMMTTRILVQFIAQIFALPLLRKRLPLSQRPYRMWLYPLPAGAALVGWVYIFSTAGWKYIAAGLITLAVGVAIFFVRAKMTRTWPYAPAQVET